MTSTTKQMRPNGKGGYQVDTANLITVVNAPNNSRNKEIVRTVPPPHQLGGLRKRSKLPSGVRSGAPAAEGFSCILCRQIASPDTSVYMVYDVC